MKSKEKRLRILGEPRTTLPPCLYEARVEITEGKPWLVVVCRLVVCIPSSCDSMAACA